MILNKDALLKCSCNSIFFEQVSTEIFDPNKFRVYKVGSGFEVYHKNITLLRCLTCGRLHIPSTSLNGKNPTDIEVQVYKIVREEVEKHNFKILNFDNLYSEFTKLKNSFDNNIDLQISNSVNYIKKIAEPEERIKSLDRIDLIDSTNLFMKNKVNNQTILNKPKRKKKNDNECKD